MTNNKAKYQINLKIMRTQLTLYKWKLIKLKVTNWKKRKMKNFNKSKYINQFYLRTLWLCISISTNLLFKVINSIFK